MKRLSILIGALFIFVSAGCSTTLTAREKGAALGGINGSTTEEPQFNPCGG